MTEDGGHIVRFTNGKSFRGYLEEGSSSRHVSDIERKTTSIEAPSGNNTDGENTDSLAGIDKWVVSLERMLEDVPEYMCSQGHPGRISRIPENIREVDVKAYEPHILSLGPYHRGKQRLQHMEKRKHVILKCFLEQKPEKMLKDYLKEIKSFESKARSFYTDIQMESEKFIQMLLLDSLFILTVFCGMPEPPERLKQTGSENRSKVNNKEIYETVNQKSEHIMIGDSDKKTQMMAVSEESNHKKKNGDAMRMLFPYFAHDLFLLENQLPLFVLEKIYAFAYGIPREQLKGILNNRVSNLLFNYTKLDSEMVIAPTEEVHHLLHLCHLFFHPKIQGESIDCELSKNSQMFRLGSAVQLYEAGVRFEARSRSTEHSLLDITFDGFGKMTMSCLHVDDNTVSLLMNLIALEQMKYPSLGLDVSGYAVLLLHLVTIPSDVKLFRRKGIIEHHLASDKEMVCLVNRLSVGLAFDYVEDKYSLKHVFKGLRSYSECRVPRWRAWLRHRYFNNPWTVITLLAASLLLLLTFVQTYYMVYSYYYPCLDCHS